MCIRDSQNFLHLPTSVGEMLAQARGLGLGMTVAHQHLGQLGAEVRGDVLANCRSRVVFQTNVKDAKILSSELPGIDVHDMTNLGAFEVFARISSGASTYPVTSGETRPLPKPLGSTSNVTALSESRFGSQADAPKSTTTMPETSADSEWDIPIGGRKIEDRDEEDQP